MRAMLEFEKIMLNTKLRSLFFKDLLKFLFSRAPYRVEIDGASLLIHPRSMVYIILRETFVHQIYKPGRDIGKVDVILDLGAYIGDFSVWASKAFHPRTIIALEPNGSFFELLQRNIELNELSNVVHAINQAIYNKESTLAESVFMRDSSASYFNEDPSGKTKATTLSNLLAVHEIEMVDYFKMDIEGAEKFVLVDENRPIFGDRVRFVSFETHEKWGFGKREALAYFDSLGYEVIQTGERGPYNQFEAYNPRFFARGE